MLENQLPLLNIEGKLIIFPRYTFYLQDIGCKIIQKGDKLSNRQLNEYLIKANLAKVLNQDFTLPDIAVYAEGKWKEYACHKYAGVRIDAGKYGNYVYYPQVIGSMNITDSNAKNMIIAFLTQYSSAKLNIIQ